MNGLHRESVPVSPRTLPFSPFGCEPLFVSADTTLGIRLDRFPKVTRADCLFCLPFNDLLDFLIKPLGFSLNDSQVKRAGLDYWPRVKLEVWEDVGAFLRAMTPAASEVALFSKRGRRPFWEIQPVERMFLFFGSETWGLPEEILSAWPDRTFHIPITDAIRSLNLSTAVGIGLYESMRANGPTGNGPTGNGHTGNGPTGQRISRYRH